MAIEKLDRTFNPGDILCASTLTESDAKQNEVIDEVNVIDEKIDGYDASITEIKETVSDLSTKIDSYDASIQSIEEDASEAKKEAVEALKGSRMSVDTSSDLDSIDASLLIVGKKVYVISEDSDYIYKNDSEWYKVEGSGESFATVAYTGSYNDLIDTPTLATVATSGSYNDLINTPEQLFERGEGDYSIVQKGSTCTAEGEYAIATGKGTNAKADYSHTEGLETLVMNDDAYPNWMDGVFGHAEGHATTAGGRASHAEGNSTITNNPSEHAEGQFNVSHFAKTEYGDKRNTQHSIGIGTASDPTDPTFKNSKNAVEVMQNGDTYIIGIGGYNGKDFEDASTIQEVINEKQDILVSGTNIKTINGNSLLGNGNIETSYIEGTYEEIYGLYSNSELIKGAKYRMTDYETLLSNDVSSYAKSTFTLEDYPTVRFDLILTALSENSFDTNVSAVYPKNTTDTTDTWFFTEQSGKWEIKYNIENDTITYDWINENGKGVIYYMKDEFGNEASYDFKNILFKRYVFEEYKPYEPYDQYYNPSSINDSSLIGNYVCPEYYDLKGSDYEFLPTFAYQLNDNTWIDYGQNKVSDEYYSDGFGMNKIEKMSDNKLNNIVIICGIFNETPEDKYECFGNTFKANCFAISMIEGSGNTFGESCSAMIIGIESENNIFENAVNGCLIGDRFTDNYIASSCNSFTAGCDCSSNKIYQTATGLSMEGGNIGNIFNGTIENVVLKLTSSNNIIDNMHDSLISNSYSCKFDSSISNLCYYPNVDLAPCDSVTYMAGDYGYPYCGYSTMVELTDILSEVGMVGKVVSPSQQENHGVDYRIGLAGEIEHIDYMLN